MYVIESDLSRPEQQGFQGIKKLGIKMQQPFQQFIPIMYQGKTRVVVFLAAIWAKVSVLAVCTELEIAVCTSMLLILFSAHAV